MEVRLADRTFMCTFLLERKRFLIVISKALLVSVVDKTKKRAPPAESQNYWKERSHGPQNDNDLLEVQCKNRSAKIIFNLCTSIDQHDPLKTV